MKISRTFFTAWLFRRKGAVPRVHTLQLHLQKDSFESSWTCFHATAAMQKRYNGNQTVFTRKSFSAPHTLKFWSFLNTPVVSENAGGKKRALGGSRTQKQLATHHTLHTSWGERGGYKIKPKQQTCWSSTLQQDKQESLLFLVKQISSQKFRVKTSDKNKKANTPNTKELKRHLSVSLRLAKSASTERASVEALCHTSELQHSTLCTRELRKRKEASTLPTKRWHNTGVFARKRKRTIWNTIQIKLFTLTIKIYHLRWNNPYRVARVKCAYFKKRETTSINIIILKIWNENLSDFFHCLIISSKRGGSKGAYTPTALAERFLRIKLNMLSCHSCNAEKIQRKSNCVHKEVIFSATHAEVLQFSQHPFSTFFISCQNLWTASLAAT